MLELFKPSSGASYSQYNPPNWSYIRSQMKMNVSRLLEYYRTYPTAVGSDHLLASVMMSVAIPKGLPLDRFYDSVQDLSMNISNAFSFTSSVSAGNVRHGNFYPGTEVILADFSDFDYVKAHANWMNIEAVTVEQHPYTALNLALLEPKNFMREPGLSVIRINLAMLMVQYRAFRLEEMKIAEETHENQRSIYQFIRMYVLPNMLFTHIDHAVINRLTLLLLGVGAPRSKQEHSFRLIPLEKEVDEALDCVVKYYSKSRRDFPTLLNGIHLLSKERLIDLVKMPDVAPTLQVNWILVLMRLRIVELLSLLCPDSAVAANKHSINSLLNTMLMLRTNRSLLRSLPAEVAAEITTQTDVVLSKIGQ